MNLMLQTLFDTMSLGSFYALSALAIGLLFGVLRLVNFAHGDFISFGAYALIVPSTLTAVTPLLGALPAYLLVPALVGFVIAISIIAYLVVFRPLRDAAPTILMVASFALSYTMQNALLLLYGSRPKTIDLWAGLNKEVSIFGLARVPTLQLATIAVTIGLLLCFLYILRRSRIGIMMRAAAEDPTTARMLGLRASPVMIAAMAMAGALAAASSILQVVQTGVLEYRMGVSLMVFAFLGTVVGGMGNLSGAVAGGFGIGAVTVLLQTFLPDQARPYRDVFVFGVVFVVLALRPNGLFPSPHVKERI